jgi:hypothetical protein
VLYDKRWEYKADPMTLDSLISWLEGQPADKAYDYSLCRGCMLAQYFTACGFDGVRMEGHHFIHIDSISTWPTIAELPAHFNEIAVGMPHTFGAALERAALAKPGDS